MKLSQALINGLFGIEIEEHRIDVNSKSLSQSKHSSELGNRKNQPYFQTDFSESMEELITAPQPTILKSHQQLYNLQKILQAKLTANEIIWPFSMPPKMTATDLNFLEQHFERPWYADYRKTLINKYGLFQHLMCGIHVSYSPTKEIVLAYQKEQQIADYQMAKNDLIFKLAKQLAGYRWLFTYLFGASIQDFNENDNIPVQIKRNHDYVKSWRSSAYGFANQKNIEILYDNFQTFENCLNEYVNNGTLFAKSEFYGPVRLKNGKGQPETQIDYLEVRMLDNNPFSIEGLDIRTLYFIHLLIIDVLVNQHSWTQEAMQENIKYNNVISLSRPNQPLNNKYLREATQLIKRLELIANKLDRPEYQTSIQWVKTMIKNPKETISGRLFEFKDLDQLGIDLGIRYKRRFQSSNFCNVPDAFQNIYQNALCQGAAIKNITNNSIIIESQAGTVQKFKK